MLTKFSAQKSLLIIYFTGVYGMTWLLQLVVLLASYHIISCSSSLILLLLGTANFGPTDVAILCILYESGINGLYVLLQQVIHWRIHPGWYIIAILLPVGLVLLSMRAANFLTQSSDHLLQLPQNIAVLVVAPLGEELGWRGFALPLLQCKYNALTASLILGVIWAGWHLPIFLLPEAPLGAFPLFVVAVIAESILLTWLYNSTRKSLPLMIVSHAAVDICLVNMASLAKTDILAPILATLLFSMAAIIVLLLNRPSMLGRDFAHSLPDAFRNAKPSP